MGKKHHGAAQQRKRIRIKNPKAKPLAQEQQAEAEAAKEKADIKKATKASLDTPARRAVFARFDSDLLYSWGADCEGFRKKLPATKSGDRGRLLDTLAEMNVPLPNSIEELFENFKDANDEPFEGSGLHVPIDDDDDAGDQPSEEEEAEEPPPPLPKVVHKSPSKDEPPTKRHKAATALDPGTCPHCLKTDQPVFCSHCGMRGDQDYGHAQNVDIRNARSALQARGTNTQTDTTSGLTKRDKELERLAAHGDPMPHFNEAGAITHLAALLQGSEAYLGPNYVPPSASLINLIRSGKLVEVGYATPITIAQAASSNSAGTTTSTVGAGEDGALRITDTIKAPPLVDSYQFVFTLVSTILPALIDRPEALNDWLTLARTVLTLERDRNWTKAARYLERTLVRCVHQRKSFGPCERGVLEAVIHENAPASSSSSSRDRAAAPTAASAASAKVAPRTQREQRDLSAVCKKYNTGTCDRGESCFYEHACSNCGKKHPLKEHRFGAPGRSPPGSGSGRRGGPGYTPASNFFDRVANPVEGKA